MFSYIRTAAYIVPIVTSLAAAASADLPPPKHPLELRDGERITLLGGTFIERMQQFGYLETLLTQTHPDKHITFRNLGWSGDNVWGESRALFGSRDDGFRRLLSDLRQTKPTLILVAYGANEANASDAGLDEFRRGLARLLDELAKIQPRIVLLGPMRRENIGPPLPEQRDYNEAVAKYASAIADEAKRRGHAYVDLLDLVGSDTGDVVSGADKLTHDGLHLTAYGHWRLAPQLALRLGAAAPWTVTLEPTVGRKQPVLRLDYPGPPDHSPDNAARFAPPAIVKVAGLSPGNYRVLIDGRKSAEGSAEMFARGVALPPADVQEDAALRQAIAEKNELFFNRYRPQNETYLFLFRKHEQGNNAVEIPQLDPLIEAKETEIAKLRVPKLHAYEIVRVEEKE